jgi:hypothetical protein
MTNLKISIGCDPEYFVREKATGKFVSAHDLLPGTKTEPHAVPRGAVQVDGVAAEFNITPANNGSSWLKNISEVTTKMAEMIGDKYELVSDPAVVFDETYFKSLPEHVRELGCNPDWNAWTGQVNDKPDGDNTTMRTGAGHIHIGWGTDFDISDSTHFDDCRIIARNLDYYLGLYSLQWDSDGNRRKLYGKAGSFRPKNYGVEYRPLSNVWLRSPELQAWVYDATFKGVHSLITTGTRIEDEFGGIARDFIDSSESWWKPEDASKSKKHKKLLNTLSHHTGLHNPPPLPKPGDDKIVEKPKGKFIYTGGAPKVKSTAYSIDSSGNITMNTGSQ